MERYWNDDVESAITQSFIIQCRAQPVGNEMTQVNLAPVLESVNDLAHKSATAICRDSRVEVNGAMSAVGAGKRIGNSALEWLGALVAKRRDNANGFAFALGT